MKYDICNNMDSHYAKWKKPGRKDHILDDDVYMKCSENSRSMETESKVMVS